MAEQTFIVLRMLISQLPYAFILYNTIEMLTVMATEAVGGYGKHSACQCLNDDYRLCADCARLPNLMAHDRKQHSLSQPIN